MAGTGGQKTGTQGEPHQPPGQLVSSQAQVELPRQPSGVDAFTQCGREYYHRGYNQNLGRLFVVCREHRPDDPPDIVGRIVRNRDAHTYQARAACLGSRYV